MSHISPVSLLEALRERPAAPGEASAANLPSVRYVLTSSGKQPLPKAKELPGDTTVQNGVVCKAMWTAADFRAFERLTAMAMSPEMPTRMRANGWLRTFIEKHGKEKCSMMLAEIRRRDEVQWREEQKSKNRERA